MKSQVEHILTTILEDIEDHLSVNLSKDKDTLRRRVHLEGVSFCTITLPTLDDLLVKGVTEGLFPDFIGWKKRGQLPLFLRSLWERIFDSETGLLLSTPCYGSIAAVRQVTRFAKKIFEVAPDERVAKSVTDFIETDEVVIQQLPPSIEALRLVFNHLYRRKLASLGLPSEFRHGPGAVAEKVGSVAKCEFSFAPVGTSLFFPDYLFRSSWEDTLSRPVVEIDEKARLVAVPKTATKPRLISIEPATSQYLQQGLKAQLDRVLHSEWATDNRYQEPNQELARKGSIDNSLATLDLSEASDRVSNELVRALFGDTLMGNLLQMTRTKDVELPDGSVLHLKKFASMGSATTFPIQIMVFSAISILGVLESENLDLTRSNVFSSLRSRQVRVYGDDIIVPTDAAGRVIELLHEFGLKVNTSKSFLKGKFRESCGEDWYDGYSVKPIYLRKAPREGSFDPVVSMVSMRNQFYHTHIYSRTVARIDSILSSWRLSEHDCSRRHVENTLCSDVDTRTRYNTPLQRREYRGIALRATHRVSRASDNAKLFFALSQVGVEHSGKCRIKYESKPIRLLPHIKWQSG